jgi:subtilisin family serine protease
MSWGCCNGEPYDPNAPFSKLSSALAEAGVVVVWSAGNIEDPSATNDGSENTMNTFALNPTPGVISVANHYDGEIGDRELGVHYSSARGKRGEPETYPDVAAPGWWVMAACPMISWCPAIFGGPGTFEGDYAYFGGTSMSAPHVAGLAAVVLEANPALSPGDVEDILEDSAFKFGEASEYIADPYNADDATSYRAGHGLVDAVGAVSLALGRGPRRAPSPCPHTVGNSVSFADRQDNLQVAPHYDITWVEASWPAPGDVVTVDVHVAELQPVPLGGPNDIYSLELQVDGEHIEVYYSPLAAVSSTTVWFGDATADAIYDPDRDVISFSIRLGESFDQRRRLGGLGAWTSMNSGTLGLVDFAYGACTIWRAPVGAA